MRFAALLFTLGICLSPMVGAENTPRPLGRIAWTSDGEILRIDPAKLPESAENPWFAVKDPSIVRHEDRWHLFCTLRKTHGGDGKPPGYIRVGYMNFTDWSQAQNASWTLLNVAADLGYH